MLLIKIALSYRERRLCRGRRRYDNSCFGHADTPLPTEVCYFSGKQLGMGYFGGKTSAAVTEVPSPCCTQGLTYPGPSAPG